MMDLENKMVELAKKIEEEREEKKKKIHIDENILKKIQNYSGTEAGYRAFKHEIGEKLSLDDFLVLKGGKTALIKEIRNILNDLDTMTVKKIYAVFKELF